VRPRICFSTAGFDPIEDGLRAKVRGFIEAMVEKELTGYAHQNRSERDNPGAPRVIGLDDRAWRRGRCYGTIIVDLERNAIIYLLPNREAGSVASFQPV